MKIIGLMPVKNEDWILARSLLALAHLCDVIIVADQNSTDRTPQILAQATKVLTIPNSSTRFHQSQARQLLLDAARAYDGHNILLAIDADEVIAANALEGTAWHNALDTLRPGTALLMPWIMLWRAPTLYRDDTSAWSNIWKHFIWRDDRQTNFSAEPIHEPRMPRALTERSTRHEQIPVLHYQFVNWERMLAKQRWYRITEQVAGLRTPTEINALYSVTRDERDTRLRALPAEWVRGWQERGIDLEHFRTEEIFWYDIETLAFFAQYGPARFASLDIWDVDWERIRQIALAQGCCGLPLEPIHDPRNIEQKLYHAYLHRYLHTPVWRRGREVVHPLWRAAQYLGVRRTHLERLRLLKPRSE